ncbi:hypothetical protein Nepgr_026479 [Nepenthes gracilis]|uniref:Homeobox domain-containing protein n=1 Tax=Nepenthes gracilis TaxID=150966 RepID=A0AAD3T9U2_NEPGR|nr:hypothetical protein Nepgr_026479 [Nepenthes gracilis]
MGIARHTPAVSTIISSQNSKILHHNSFIPKISNSMSQDYHHHQAIFTFPSGFDRSALVHHEQQAHQPPEQQIRLDKLRIEGFEPASPLVGIGQPDLYETGGMLSEMFNFRHGPGSATDLLEHQIPLSYRNPRMPGAEFASAGWCMSRQSREPHHQISSIHPDSAAAMQLFLTNPQPRSPSPPPLPPPADPNTSTLHMLLPNPRCFNSIGSASTNPVGGGFPHGVITQPQLTWVPETAAHVGDAGGAPEIGGFVEGQGLSLSLSSSLQHLEAAKAVELRNMGGDGEMLFFNQGGGEGASSSNSGHHYSSRNLGTAHHDHRHQTIQRGHHHHHNTHHNQINVGLGSSLGVVNMLRNSKYSKPAKELLEEFCSVGRIGHLIKKTKSGDKHYDSLKPSGSATPNAGGGSAGSLSSSKDPPPLSSADRMEYQRRKVKLLSMLDEVDRRYNHYCEQMQMVVNSFDLVMGAGAATPYTALAQKAMSRHFRCLKDAVHSQYLHSCELLGDRDASGTPSGLTKGETPRLRLLEQSFRQQRAFHQMGIMEQEAWRPQRGLPERSVNILRAWLFEHFLHPYPSDADKHLLARQTGLSRNQVSNWFINARVRLWKPMVEEMYQQEAKDNEPAAAMQISDTNQSTSSSLNITSQTPTPPPPAPPPDTAVATTPASAVALARQGSSSENHAKQLKHLPAPPQKPPALSSQGLPTDVRHQKIMNRAVDRDTCHDLGTTSGADSIIGSDAAAALIRFGTTSAGDVSLTLGLRHAGAAPPEKCAFSLGDFGS